jgi:hypothetical protein
MFNKTVFVYYINVENLSREEVGECMKIARDNGSIKNNVVMSDEDKEDVVEIFIPTREGQTRIEMLTRPTFVTLEEEKYAALLNLERLDNKLDRVVSYINAEAERREVIIEKNPPKRG